MAIDISIAYDALTNDASTWDTTADGLSAAADAADGIELPRGAFSFMAEDLADQYIAMSGHLVGLLRGGAKAGHDGATALRLIRQDFEDTSQEIIQDLDDLWQFKY